MKTIQLGVDKFENYEIYFCLYDEGMADIDVVDRKGNEDWDVVYSMFITKKDLIELRNLLNKVLPKGI